ncbi:hypothetical protein HYALB_00001505, partial [Hymenoscyphus albidus]
MPPELIPDDEEYASEEDSDFAPDTAPAKGDDEESSDEEAEPVITEVKSKPTKRKRGTDTEEAEDAGFENSGDEAIIERGLKRQKRKGKKGKDEAPLDDEGGEGGLVKTRSMRAAEKTEKKVALQDTSKSTVDVDALWASMISGKPLTDPTTQPQPSSPKASNGPELKRTNISPAVKERNLRSPSTINDGPHSMILIKRSYHFAGKLHHEQKLVPKSSAEARLFLASQPVDSPTPTPTSPPKRAPKKARRSIFEPQVDLPIRTDLNLGVRKEEERVESMGKEKKLNTVEKSAMDWAGFVDKEGIGEELDKAGKSRGAYRERQEFLARVEGKKEEEARRARGI